MAVEITDPLPAKGSGVILVSFFDENQVAVVPKVAHWTLTDKNGNVINYRKNVAIAPLAAVSRIVLTNLDLLPDTSLKKNVNQLRYLKIRAAYDSTFAGTDLPLVGELKFYVENPVPVVGETLSLSPSASVSPSPSLSPSASVSPSVSPSASASPSA